MAPSLIARDGTPIELDRSRVLFFDKEATFTLARRYGTQFLRKLGTPTQVGNGFEIEIHDYDMLQFCLWLGLQRDAEAHGETLTPADCDAFFVPATLEIIANLTVVAIYRNINTEPVPGKAEAATASPAAAAKKGRKSAASTTGKRKGSPTASSGKPGKSSGPAR